MEEKTKDIQLVEELKEVKTTEFIDTEGNRIKKVASGVKINGKLIRTKKWLRERTDQLRLKRREYAERIRNIDAEIAQREAEIDTAMTDKMLDDKLIQLPA